MTFPKYLEDLHDASVAHGCSCATKTNTFDLSVNYTSPLANRHETYQGADVEHAIDSEEYPYHQHVHPYQIMVGDAVPADPNLNAYYQVGDWQDILTGPHTV